MSITGATTKLTIAAAAIFAAEAAAACGNNYDEPGVITMASATHSIARKGITRGIARKAEPDPSGVPLGTKRIATLRAGNLEAIPSGARCPGPSHHVSFIVSRQAFEAVAADMKIRTVIFDFNGNKPNGSCPRFPALVAPHYEPNNISPNITKIQGRTGDDRLYKREVDAINAAQCVAFDFDTYTP